MDDKLLNVLSLLYTSPQRYYHTFSHAHFVKYKSAKLAELEGLSPNEQQEVELAAWFHDVIYVPGQKDNESRSAELAMALGPVYYPDVNWQTVGDLILLTAGHLTARRDQISSSGAVLLDADLAGLGSSPAVFALASESIRKEFSFVPLGVYRAGRKAFLQTLLQKDRIFLTDTARDKWEKRARGNIEAEILSLG